jgi:hypothetical protein
MSIRSKPSWSKKACFLLITCFLSSSLLAQAPSKSQGKVTTRSCEQNLYIGIASVELVDILWIDCTEDEPATDPDYQHSQQSGFLDIFALVKNVPYNVSGVAGEPPEEFWFLLGAGGDQFCIDDQDFGLMQNNRIVLPSINTCYETSIWVDMMTQCQDCNNNLTAPKGHWWKTEEEFSPNQLTGLYTSSSSPFLLDPLGYQNLVDCEWNVEYGCQDGEHQ